MKLERPVNKTEWTTFFAVHAVIIVHNRKSGACSGILQRAGIVYFFFSIWVGLRRQRLEKKGDLRWQQSLDYSRSERLAFPLHNGAFLISILCKEDYFLLLHGTWHAGSAERFIERLRGRAIQHTAYRLKQH